MRVAWFHPDTPDADVAADDTRPLVAELRSRYDIDLIDASRAHQFVWQHARQPYDACVYELADSPAHQYVWPYLLHVPGILCLRASSLRESRSAALRHERREDDDRAELAFAGRPMLRVALSAARLVVVPDRAIAQALEAEYPGVRIAVAPIGVDEVRGAGVRGAQVRGAEVRFGVLPESDLATIERAASRARDAGAGVEIVIRHSLDELMRESDVLIALAWPPTGAPSTTTLAAMASGMPCIVLETETNAAWPALDPQTWQPRDPLGATPPAVVSLDSRDEEHSLVLAMRRMSTDAALGAALGEAARAWWQSHATVAHAADAWRSILERAATLPLPSPQRDWPAHLTADGTERAREILGEFGVTVDFLDS